MEPTNSSRFKFEEGMMALRPPRTAIAATALTLLVMLGGTAPEVAHGVACTPEPTDMTITYGALVSCAIGVVGDTDLFRFTANSGEAVTIQATRTAGAGTPLRSPL